MGNSGEAKGEVNWSLGDYRTPGEIKRAFGVKTLPPPKGIAPNQPFRHKSVYYAWAVFCGLAIVFNMYFALGGDSNQVFQRSYVIPATTMVDPGMTDPASPLPLPSEPATTPPPSPPAWTNFESQLEIVANRNIRVSLNSPVDNSWLEVDGDLFNEETGLVQSFSAQLEYYQGVEDGESWSEGEKSTEIFLSALPAGKYTLRLEAQRQSSNLPTTLGLKIDQGHRRPRYLFVLLLVLSIVPGLVWIWQLMFERMRWTESDFSPYG